MDERLLTILSALEDDPSADIGALCGGDLELQEQLERYLAMEGRIRGTGRAHVESTDDSPAALQRLGGYTIVAPIGVGGMSEVYVAYQESLKRTVALKVISPERGDHDRLRREARIAASLDHPNIVPIYEVGEDRGVTFIAMKWLRGPALDALTGPLDPREVARIGIAVARGLEEAHLSGVVHRDIKPGNIILDDGVPYIVDFGLARRPTEHTLTAAGALVGTLHYMAPENLRSGSLALGPRSDVYSLGATLYQVATGRLCFDGEDQRALLHDILLKEPPPLGLPSAQRDLETIVLRALSKEESARFASAAELADDLERYRSGTPIRSRRMGPGARLWLYARRRPRAAAAASVLLAIAAGFAALWVRASLVERARWRETQNQVDGAVAEESYEVARQLLATYGSGESTRSEALRRRVDWEEARSRLLDQVMRSGEAQRDEELEALVKRVSARPRAARRDRVTDHALALANLHLGERDAALRALDAMAGDRATYALRRLAEGHPLDPDSLPAPDRADPDAHLFTAFAMRYGGVAPARVLQEIQQVLADDPQHFRARFAQANVYYDQGRYELALGQFQGMLVRDRRVPALRRNIAQVLMVLGKLDDAMAELKRIPHDEWTPADYSQWVNLRWRREGGDPGAVLADVEEALARFPRSRRLLEHAISLSEPGQLADCRDYCQRMLAVAGDSPRWAEPAQVTLDLIELRSADPAEVEARRARLLERVDALTTTAARAKALTALAQHDLGRATQPGMDATAAREHLTSGAALARRAIDTDPSHPTARLCYLAAIATMAGSGALGIDGSAEAEVRRAVDLARDMADDTGGEISASRDAAVIALYYAALTLHARGDREAGDLARLAMRRVEQEGQSWPSEDVEAAMAQLDHAYPASSAD